MAIDYELYEGDKDEEYLRELYRIRITNSRKSMAATYAYLILMEQTDENHHMTQKELSEKLAASPINIELDRKAISRIVYTLADSGIGITALPKGGIWYSSKNVWFDSAM